ncbi:MAG: hypothetical protein Q3985_07240 [Eubacteriales bacterium]|nr:hypothetical protein [Eubacteriales bacterium]
MAVSFKKCMFGGFYPEDVIAYIDKTAKETQAQIAALSEENEGLQRNNREMRSELDMLRQQSAEHDRETLTAAELRKQLDAAQEKLQMLEEEAAMLRTQSQDYQSLKEHIADIEINAHRRTEEFRAATVAQMQEIVNKQRNWCYEMKTKYLSVTEQFSQKLQQAQEVLDHPDISGFTEMEESLYDLESNLSH